MRAFVGAASVMAAVGALAASAQAAPVNTVAPSIGGSLQPGQVLTRSLGSWTSWARTKYRTQWELCNASGGECSPTARGTHSTLSLKSADVGHEITVVVTATERSGQSTTATAARVGPIGVSHYLDCARGNDSSSGLSEAHAWRTLAKVSSVLFRPGDAIRIHRGTRCTGVLSPQGSGTLAGPIVVEAYGSGPKPQIAGEGARATVVLDNVQGWTLRDLAISDEGSTEEPGVLRTGISISAGSGSGYVIEDDEVENVDSAPLPQTSGVSLPTSVAGVEGEGSQLVWKVENRSKVSGGIQVDGGLRDVRIEDNTLVRTDREGIFVEGGGITGLVIKGNTLKEIGGDGIVAVATEGALIEHNVVRGFNEEGTSFNAGVWAYGSTGDVFQFNDVSGGQHGPEDTMAYDIDGSNRDIVYQYNLSHDNSGGFLMLCNNVEPFGTGSANGGDIVRYNISQNDFAVVRGVIDAPFACATENNIQIYNNTVVTDDPNVTSLVENTNESSAHFINNILMGPGSQAGIYDHSSTSTWANNLYDGVTCVIRPSDPHALIAKPRFVAPGTATSLETANGYQLRTRSEALDAGVLVPDNGGRDYFGDLVSATSVPNIGAYQGPGVELSDGSLEKIEESAPANAPGC